MKRSGLLPVLGVVILFIMPPLGFFMGQKEDDGNTDHSSMSDIAVMENRVAREFVEHLVRNTTELLQGENVTCLEDLILELNRDEGRISQDGFNPYPLTEGTTRFSVNDLNLTARSGAWWTDRQATIPIEDERGMWNIELKEGPAPSNSSYMLEGTFTLAALDQDTGVEDRRAVGFSEPVFAPGIFARASLDAFNNECSTDHGDLARTVTSMLSTLARHRTSMGYGMGLDESHLNIINTGDVELAVNLALLIMQGTLLGSVDSRSAAVIHNNHANAMDNSSHENEDWWSYGNPTGERQWGVAELTNHDRYLARKESVGDTGSLEALLVAHLGKSTLDPSDIMALYLLLAEERGGDRPDPSDRTGFLAEHNLLDPRMSGSEIDVQNLECTFSSDGDFDGFSLGNGGVLRLVQQRSPGQLVAGRDMVVQGLNSPVATMTSAVPLPASTRTWTVPPGSPPPFKDFEIQWDIRITGSFLLEVVPQIFPNNVSQPLPADPVERVIDIDIPVLITAWPRGKPQNDALIFRDLNTGGAGITGEWLITGEAMAFHYFEHDLWPVLGQVLTLDHSALITASSLYSSWGHDRFLSMDKMANMGELVGALSQDREIASPSLEGYLRELALIYWVDIGVVTDPGVPVSTWSRGWNLSIYYEQELDILNLSLERGGIIWTLTALGLGETAGAEISTRVHLESDGMRLDWERRSSGDVWKTGLLELAVPGGTFIGTQTGSSAVHWGTSAHPLGNPFSSRGEVLVLSGQRTTTGSPLTEESDASPIPGNGTQGTLGKVTPLTFQRSLEEGLEMVSDDEPVLGIMGGIMGKGEDWVYRALVLESDEDSLPMARELLRLGGLEIARTLSRSRLDISDVVSSLMSAGLDLSRMDGVNVKIIWEAGMGEAGMGEAGMGEAGMGKSGMVSCKVPELLPFEDARTTVEGAGARVSFQRGQAHWTETGSGWEIGFSPLSAAGLF